MDETQRRPLNKQTTIDVSVKVYDLIDGSGNWRVDAIGDLFLEK